MDVDNTHRFSGKAEVYARYRPGYPVAILRELEIHRGFSSRSVVADVGSGTGKLTEIFLQNGNTVFAVEPNRDMREEAERVFVSDPRFHSVDATAEATGLAAASVDLIAAGQAFHWFDPDRSKTEFRRILRPGGCVLLVWNDHDTVTSPFLQDYNEFLKVYCREGVRSVAQRRPEAEVIRDFLAADYRRSELPNAQEFDLPGLWGRYRSASYSIPDDDPRQPGARAALEAIFHNHQAGGRVSFPMRTVMHYGSV